LERPTSPPPRRSQSPPSEQTLSPLARIPGESRSESSWRALSSDVQREPLAEGRSQVERPRRRRPQAAPQQPSIAPSSGVRETPAGEEPRQASRRDASSTSPTARFGSRAGEDAGKSRGKDASARAEQGAEEAGAVPGKPVQFRSDWTGAVLTTQQQLRLETLKPLMKTSEERESR